MITLNIIETFFRELEDFFGDIKILFGDFFKDIHNFLNRFIADDVLIVFAIAIIAFLAIMVFRYVINKR